ncbi:MAG: vacuolar family H+-ATPase subunit H [Lachnospiraceae bacterium]|nr:vacuolar family H+-ATPase subunit H [Lachnospiraceae bacterium]MBD5455893.1 vacuolar family H+-ATPase subunit H [Lachnospiraceae bacterium]
MSSRIEQLIDEIEEYIDGCKYQPFSNTKIIVDKEEIDELLRELRMKTPDEIKRYQKIISNKEAILNDARAKAEALINEATLNTTRLVNEHEIMQQAYAQANEVVTMATQQAQEILDSATIEANNMRTAAMQYTDGILANVENLLNQTMRSTQDHFDSFMGVINNYSDVINANRMELNPPEADTFIDDTSDTASDNLNIDML